MKSWKKIIFTLIPNANTTGLPHLNPLLYSFSLLNSTLHHHVVRFECIDDSILPEVKYRSKFHGSGLTVWLTAHWRQVLNCVVLILYHNPIDVSVNEKCHCNAFSFEKFHKSRYVYRRHHSCRLQCDIDWKLQWRVAELCFDATWGMIMLFWLYEIAVKIKNMDFKRMSTEGGDMNDATTRVKQTQKQVERNKGNQKHQKVTIPLQRFMKDMEK